MMVMARAITMTNTVWSQELVRLPKTNFTALLHNMQWCTNFEQKNKKNKGTSKPWAVKMLKVTIKKPRAWQYQNVQNRYMFSQLINAAFIWCTKDLSSQTEEPQSSISGFQHDQICTSNHCAHLISHYVCPVNHCRISKQNLRLRLTKLSLIIR